MNAPSANQNSQHNAIVEEIKSRVLELDALRHGNKHPEDIELPLDYIEALDEITVLERQEIEEISRSVIAKHKNIVRTPAPKKRNKNKQRGMNEWLINISFLLMFSVFVKVVFLTDDTPKDPNEKSLFTRIVSYDYSNASDALSESVGSLVTTAQSLIPESAETENNNSEQTDQTTQVHDSEIVVGIEQPGSISSVIIAADTTSEDNTQDNLNTQQLAAINGQASETSTQETTALESEASKQPALVSAMEPATVFNFVDASADIETSAAVISSDYADTNEDTTPADISLETATASVQQDTVENVVENTVKSNVENIVDTLATETDTELVTAQEPVITDAAADSMAQITSSEVALNEVVAPIETVAPDETVAANISVAEQIAIETTDSETITLANNEANNSAEEILTAKLITDTQETEVLETEVQTAQIKAAEIQAAEIQAAEIQADEIQADEIEAVTTTTDQANEVVVDTIITEDNVEQTSKDVGLWAQLTQAFDEFMADDPEPKSTALVKAAQKSEINTTEDTVNDDNSIKNASLESASVESPSLETVSSELAAKTPQGTIGQLNDEALDETIVEPTLVTALENANQTANETAIDSSTLALNAETTKDNLIEDNSSDTSTAAVINEPVIEETIFETANVEVPVVEETVTEETVAEDTVVEELALAEQELSEPQLAEQSQDSEAIAPPTTSEAVAATAIIEPTNELLETIVTETNSSGNSELVQIKLAPNDNIDDITQTAIEAALINEPAPQSTLDAEKAIAAQASDEFAIASTLETQKSDNSSATESTQSMLTQGDAPISTAPPAIDEQVVVMADNAANANTLQQVTAPIEAEPVVAESLATETLVAEALEVETLTSENPNTVNPLNSNSGTEVTASEIAATETIATETIASETIATETIATETIATEASETEITAAVANPKVIEGDAQDNTAPTLMAASSQPQSIANEPVKDMTEQLSAIVELTQLAKMSVSEFYMFENKLPTPKDNIVLPVNYLRAHPLINDIFLDENSDLVIKLEQDFGENKKLTLTPSVSSTGSFVNWDCGTNVNPNMIANPEQTNCNINNSAQAASSGSSDKITFE